jgi:hypothetical protein
MSLTALLIIGGFAYSIVATIHAYREMGKIWILSSLRSIDAQSAIARSTWRTGKLAVAILYCWCGCISVKPCMMPTVGSLMKIYTPSGSC